MLEAADKLTGEEAEFLARMVDLDLNRVAVPLSLQSVISDRLKEVEICFENGAYLAVSSSAVAP